MILGLAAACFFALVGLTIAYFLVAVYSRSVAPREAGEAAGPPTGWRATATPGSKRDEGL
jgi:hypothetical protein